ncbi:MAG: MFS transporter [Planctomycetaceae bacterium]|nr:MFS transporter [Planctomycetaceae bacterium]
MNTDSTAATDSSPSTTHPTGGLLDRAFLGLLGANFLGVTNDNIFRWLVIGIGKELVAPEHQAKVLSFGLACLVLPFILLATPAGWLADRFSKTRVVVATKGLEFFVMLLGVVAILQDNIYALFAVLFLMGAQSAMFAPAKLGSLPEIVRPNRLSAANATLGLTTVIAIVLGTVIGNYVYDETKLLRHEQWWILGAIIAGVALAGWCCSLFMRYLPADNPTRPFPWNPFAQTVRDLMSLNQPRALLRVAMGSAFFWTLASLTQLTVDAFGIQTLGLTQKEIGPLMGVLTVGVAIGNVLAGIWSRGRVELGLVPMAAAALSGSAASLFLADGVWMSCCSLFCLGVAAGMFDVPLASYLQHRSPPEKRGAILAASNLLTYSGMLLASLIFWLVQLPRGPEMTPLLSPRGIFLLAGALSLPVAIYAFTLLPLATSRLLVWLITSTIYRVKLVNEENIPATGGAILTPNHVSWMDGLLLGVATERPIRMVIYADYYDMWPLKHMFALAKAIPIKPGNRRSVIDAIRTAREALKNGEVVCIFPEGGLSRTGQLMGFQPGLLSFLKDTGVPVIPVFLGGLWGSIFSFQGGKYFWKRPRRIPYRAHFVFGKPLENVTSVDPVRKAVLELGAQAMDYSQRERLALPRLFIRACRRSRGREKVVDTTGQRLTGSSLLLRTLILRRLFLKHVLQPDETHVGVLLPPSAGAVLVNAAMPLCGRVAVNLNYTVSQDVMNHCIRDAGIRHVITSRQVMKKLDMQLDAEIVYLEDFRKDVTMFDKLAAAFQAFAVPAFLLDRWLGLHKIKPSDVITIIFTSGSTGEPKGVMLTYENVGSNVQAIGEIVKIDKNDTLLGILPFFHSLGYTVTCWTILTLELKGAYHFSPLEAQKIGELCREEKGTLLLCTPTFLRSYLKRVPAEDFKTLNVIVGGAEKLPVDLCEAFEQKFGVRPVEGYGTTECAPLVSVNIPASRQPPADGFAVYAKEGTVGRPIEGVAARIVDPDSGRDLGTDEPGMLLIKGPNVMRGYLNKPDKTAAVLKDGWYTTGDIALVDVDGFIKITGRQSRFSKIGGEMVPHIKIEETLQGVIQAGEDELKLAVTAVPDARKGERLVVVHTALAMTPAEICKRLGDAGLPNIWIPSPDSFIEVEAIPHLGTGKLDLKGLKDLALSKFGSG